MHYPDPPVNEALNGYWAPKKNEEVLLSTHRV